MLGTCLDDCTRMVMDWVVCKYLQYSSVLTVVADVELINGGHKVLIPPSQWIIFVTNLYGHGQLTVTHR